MKKYLTEFIGTFFLMLTVIMTSNNPVMAPMAPFAIAGMYMAMVYAGGPISGGHFNPAITVAMLIRKTIDRGDALYYIMVQFMASIVAAAIGAYLHDCGGGLNIVERINEQPICVVLGEFLGTFALVYVLLNVEPKSDSGSQSFHGLAIGFVLLSVTLALGGLSGGIFNPALALGGSVAGMFGWPDLIVYWIGAFLGAAASVTVVQLLADRAE
jgi:aquaporin Z